MATPRLLLVEDDAPLAGMLRAHLERDGYEVVQAADGATALNEVRRRSPDVVVLDIGLPGLDGFEVCRVLRSRANWVPLVFLTARDSEDDRVLGMDLGADDYVTKPFSPRELSSRLRALLRRTGPAPAEVPDVITLGGVRIDVAEHLVTVDGAPVELTPREYALLLHLARAPGRVHSRQHLLEQVWGDVEAGPRTVDVHVAQLRAKGIHLRTVRGAGYAAVRA